MKLKYETAALLVALIALIAVVTALTLLYAVQSIRSTATVATVNVGVYKDVACTVNCTTISWGAVAPSGSQTYTVYVKNLGTVPMSLSMTTSDWNPASTSGFVTVSWNRENYSLDAGFSVNATLTLAVSPSVSGITNFDFNINIKGTG